MNLLHNKPKVKTLSLKNYAARWLYAVFIIPLFLSSCKDDLNIQENNEPSIITSGSIVTVKLPGYIGVQIDEIGQFATRAGENTTTSSDDKRFDDGIAAEYAFASGAYHYLVIYQGGYNENVIDKPLAVIPLSIGSINTDVDGKDEKDPETGKITKYDNLTLVANSLVSSKDIISSHDYSNAATVATLFKGNLIVALMNFDKDLFDYSTLSDSRITDQSTTAAVLTQITKGDLLNNLCVKDWKITVSGVNYLTMTNSVCPVDGTTDLDYNYSVDSQAEQRVYPNESMARSNPIAGVYVERLAVKYTVSFDTSSVSSSPNNGSELPGSDEGSDSPSASEGAKATPTITIDERGFPQYTVNIQKYTNVSFTSPDNSSDPDNNSNPGYSINSEPSSATVKIIGYGVSNLEKKELLLKKIGSDNYYTNWNNYGKTLVDKNHRCYWTIDPHYPLTKSVGDLSNASGYPHQFRYALETDTIQSLFENKGNGYIYHDRNHYYDDVSYTSNGVTYTTRYFSEIGEINEESLSSDCFLNYKSFNTLKDEFEKNIYDSSAESKGKPFYSRENTYYDPGMKMGSDQSYKESANWAWEWKRAPYATATNLIVLCKLIPDGTTNQTVYRGQNNIFYYTLCVDVEPGHEDDIDQAMSPGLLNSKLYILNNVMLNGGNAGFQIFDGKWDAHERGTKTTILDKIAWNENAFVWLRYVDEGVTKYRRMLPQDFTLIPAEIAGGDGQALIAPRDEIMGKDFRYYIAPYKKVTTTNPETGISTTTTTNEMDQNLGVQISFNHLVGLIHKIIGPVDVFEEGYMYYSVPISHSESSFLEDYNLYNKKITEQGLSDSPKTKNDESWRTLGKIGVVRNNWYNITIDNITGVGTPVHSVTQPIVPVMEIRRSYINMGVKLMGWHHISQNGVPM